MRRILHGLCARPVVLSTLACLVAVSVWSSRWRVPASARSSRPERAARGTYGAELDFLRRHCAGPRNQGESNYFLDLWAPGRLESVARLNGLTNNRALFIDSHGRAGCSARGDGFGLYPREALFPSGRPAPCFSIADVAAMLGPQAAASVHNVLLAACNLEGRLRPAEVRRHFVNATNITMMEAGKIGLKPMFLQAMLQPSSGIKPLYGRPLRAARAGAEPRGQAAPVEFEILDQPAPGAAPLGSYWAHLYRPGGRWPYTVQKAGRELLGGGR